MKSIVFHIDVNSAYLSWSAAEQLKSGAKIDIRTVPAIIGGDQQSRHGVVLAKSIPARKYGIRTGEPVSNAFSKCPNLLSVPPNHKLYHEKSRLLMNYLKSFTPDIEQVSVDECYMDYTGIAHRFASPVEGAAIIKDGVREKFGFTVNIGISTAKVLAKMASDFEKPDKVHTLFPEEIPEKMWPLPMEELFMAGHASVETLKKLEIKTIGDLAKADPKLIELHLKSHGRMLWEFANGIDHNMVQTKRAEAKGIGNSTTLSDDLTTFEEVQEVLLRLAESVGGRLRKAGQKANMVSVEIKYYDFQTSSHQKQLTRPADADVAVYQAACGLFEELWTGEPVRLLGIRTSKLVDAMTPVQMSLFDLIQSEPEEKSAVHVKNSGNFNTDCEEQEDEKHKKVNEALDAIRKRYGADAVMRATLMEKKHGKDKKEL
ncbi:MAG: DNA polymerase IV [Hespellia sp.]|nr:DNA polymerase IV [Hespellia sp.]